MNEDDDAQVLRLGPNGFERRVRQVTIVDGGGEFESAQSELVGNLFGRRVDVDEITQP